MIKNERNNDTVTEESKESDLNKKIDFDLDLELLGSDGFNCLHVACGSGHIDLVKFLLQMKRLNPNTKGHEGWTALEIAATSGVLEIVQTLLADKRTIFVGGSSRGSALHLAAQIPNGFKICQTLLLENPKLLQIKDS